MTVESVGPDKDSTELRRPQVALAVLVGALLVTVVGWVAFGSYTGSEVRECTALYAAAHTADDTTRVDLTVTPAAQKHAEPRSCGSLRRSARWQ